MPPSTRPIDSTNNWITILQIERKESALEKAFNVACRRYGGIPKKQTAGGGDLDRRVIWDNGVTTYAEIKRGNKGVVSPEQERELGLLLGKGHLAMVIRNEMDIAMFIKLSMERVHGLQN